MENSLLKKLMIKPGHKLQLVHAPEHAAVVLGPIPEDIHMAGGEEAPDAVLLFVADSAMLAGALAAVSRQLSPVTVFWILYPKKKSGMESDLHGMAPWKVLDDYGLAIVSSAGINEVWTAVRIRGKGQAKASGMCLEDIAKNEYGRYIDVQQRTVTIPEDLLQAMQAQPGAVAWFEQLSFSHKKEYLLWVLSARKEATRARRIGLTVEKLLARRKAPAEK